MFNPRDVEGMQPHIVSGTRSYIWGAKDRRRIATQLFGVEHTRGLWCMTASNREKVLENLGCHDASLHPTFVGENRTMSCCHNLSGCAFYISNLRVRLVVTLTRKIADISGMSKTDIIKTEPAPNPDVNSKTPPVTQKCSKRITSEDKSCTPTQEASRSG